MQNLSSYVLEYLGLVEGIQSKVYVAKGLPGGLSDWEKVKFASHGVYSLSPSISLLNFKFVFDWVYDTVVFVVPDEIDESVIKGAHLTVGSCDMYLCKVSKVSLCGASEEDYRYKDLIYGGKMFNVGANAPNLGAKATNAPNVAGGRSCSTSSSDSSDGDLGGEEGTD